MKFARARLLCACVAMPGLVQAGRPLTTEDASILEAKACQLETWIDRSRVATDFWFVPACNFGADIEWQLGGSRTRMQGEGGFSQSYFQAKTAFVSVTEHPWGIGLVLGVQRFPLRETESGWSDPFALLPVSFQLGAEDRLLHFNVGWTRDKAEKRNVTLWGIALEASLPGGVITAVGEAFGENARTPFVRLGGRWNQLAKNLDVDLTFVGKSGGTKAERFVSVGLYYKFDNVIP
jgi:hypothetical protein